MIEAFVIWKENPDGRGFCLALWDRMKLYWKTAKQLWAANICIQTGAGTVKIPAPGVKFYQL